MTITQNSQVRITIGTRQVYGTVKAVYNSNESDSIYYNADKPHEYWDIEYEIRDPAPGRGNIGRWKQNLDGGHIALA